MDRAYFEQEDVVYLARNLLGKLIRTNMGGVATSAWITETEAYKAPEDRASHAFGNRRTSRTEVMFGPPGHAYVYLNYGIHHLFNVVTGPEDMAHAILIRAVLPRENQEIQLQRRGKKQADSIDPEWFNGPGKVSQALGIRTDHNGLDLCSASGLIQIMDEGVKLSEHQALERPRIGIDYAGDWKEKPWRFTLRDVSRFIDR